MPNLPPVPPVMMATTRSTGDTGGKSKVTSAPLTGVPGVERRFVGARAPRKACAQVRLQVTSKRLEFQGHPILGLRSAMG